MAIRANDHVKRDSRLKRITTSDDESPPMLRPMESPALGTKMQIKSAMAEVIPNVSQEPKTGYPA